MPCLHGIQVGALELESAEIRVKFDANNKTVEDLVAKAGLEIHETVAECGLGASLPQFLVGYFPCIRQACPMRL